MESFNDLIRRAHEYLGQDQSSIDEKREIAELVTAHPELVDSFFEAVDSTPGWKELSRNNLAYYINRVESMRISRVAKARLRANPKIQPMIWGDLAGKVAVIKITK